MALGPAGFLLGVPLAGDQLEGGCDPIELRGPGLPALGAGIDTAVEQVTRLIAALAGILQPDRGELAESQPLFLATESKLPAPELCA